MIEDVKRDTGERNMMNNKGSASLEATLIVPLFVFMVMTVYHMGRSKMCQEVLYEASVETVEYVSEYVYVANENIVLYGVIANSMFDKYIDRPELLEKYVEGGKSGVYLSVKGHDEDDYIEITVNYTIRLGIPIFGLDVQHKSYVIRQKAYVGYTTPGEEENRQTVEYVYITDNKEVYHITRECTHLKLSIIPASISLAKKGGYTPCEFCYVGGDSVYVTEWGNRYHSIKNCSGLKRTVYRVEKNDIPDIPPCSRCGYE